MKQTLAWQLAVAFSLLGLMGSCGVYVLGRHSITQAYDRDLENDLANLALHVSRDGGQWRALLSPAAERWLLINEGERVVYRILDLEHHAVLVRSPGPSVWPETGGPSAGTRFYTRKVGDTAFRIGQTTLPVGAARPSLLIEVGETLGRRERLTRQLMGGMALLFLGVTLVATLLVRWGLGRAFRPLETLKHQVSERSVDDLTPLEPALAPHEVRGLLHAINDMMARVSRSVDVRTRFIANVAHQLRTPLAGLSLHAQLVARDGALPASAQGQVDEIHRGARRLSHVIDQLLVLARAESGRADWAGEPVDLIDTVRTVVQRYLVDADRKGVDLGFDGDLTQATVLGNRVLLEELLANLIDNAIRYGRRDGAVTVSVVEDAGNVVLRVKDDGPGMVEGDDLFVRFRRAAEPGGEGAGLGLAIVREIAQAHDAVLSCTTAPGQGVDVAIVFGLAAGGVRQIPMPSGV
ncbi:MAG TPA: sensor histidine kinase [Candidatus Aquabacterium excrementipullorum]|nr:sensor histidine kinase [Candidatus Aquabacterium excrementipullorum]